MEILAQDKSSYLKGLLIIAKKDNVLAESEEFPDTEEDGFGTEEEEEEKPAFEEQEEEQEEEVDFGGEGGSMEVGDAYSTTYEKPVKKRKKKKSKTTTTSTGRKIRKTKNCLSHPQ